MVVIVVAGGTFHKMVVVVIVMEMMIHILTITLNPGQLPKAMSNRAQNLYLSEVLLSY